MAILLYWVAIEQEHGFFFFFFLAFMDTKMDIVGFCICYYRYYNNCYSYLYLSMNWAGKARTTGGMFMIIESSSRRKL